LVTSYEDDMMPFFLWLYYFYVATSSSKQNVLLGTHQAADSAPVELNVELVDLLARPVHVHAVVVMGIAYKHRIRLLQLATLRKYFQAAKCQLFPCVHCEPDGAR
jgi:hypothetical protein